MAQPVTTTDLLLQEAVGLLTEIRGLLQDSQPPQKQAAIREPARTADTGAKKASTRPRKTTSK